MTRLPIVLGVAFAAFTGRAAADDEPLTLHPRTQVETSKGSGRYHTVVKRTRWEPKKTAIVICDMWDKHWSANATRRVAEMAPRINAVVTAARKQGVFIIHCPSDTMDFYKDTPQRKRAQSAPKVEPKVPLERWCRLDPAREAPLPIDDSDGGDDSDPPSKTSKSWSRQIATIRMADEDAVTDSAEAYYLLQQRGIDNVIVMGVHANMCVLGRPFSIRQMVKQGKNVVLMRDLTDTMYNPKRAPYVSHFTGTDLVVEHIERYWCPTVTSADVLGGKAFRFKDDTRPHLAVVVSEDEYRTEKTLPEFARKHLGKDFRVNYVFGNDEDRNDLPGIDVLNEADLALFSVRRRVLPAKQLAVVRKFVAAGKPVAAVRTSSHAFARFKGAKVPEGHAEWADFDRDVLGCHYTGHHDAKLQTTVRVVPDQAKHPILTGVRTEEFPLPASLYKVSPLEAGATALMTGRAAGQKQPEPVAWTFKRKDGGRTFSTSLGHPDDFKSADFERLLRNGILWAAGLPVPAASGGR